MPPHEQRKERQEDIGKGQMPLAAIMKCLDFTVQAWAAIRECGKDYQLSPSAPTHPVSPFFFSPRMLEF